MRWTAPIQQLPYFYKLAREAAPSRVTSVIEAALFEELGGGMRPEDSHQREDRVGHRPKLLFRVVR